MISQKGETFLGGNFSGYELRKPEVCRSEKSSLLNVSKPSGGKFHYKYLLRSGLLAEESLLSYFPLKFSITQVAVMRNFTQNSE